MNKRISALFTLILLISINLSGCKPKTSIVFPEECSAPCWREIVSGKTSKMDALSTIKSFPDIDMNDFHVRENSDTVFSNIIVFKLKGGEIVRIYLINDIVVLINLEPLNGTVTVQDCVQKFGTPEFIALSTIFGSGIPIGATSAEHILFYGINIQKGILLGGDTYKWFSSQANITPKTGVFVVDFFDPQTFDVLLENDVLVNSIKGYSRAELVSWKGYGNVTKLYHP
jgi:hypothetical protein